MRMKIKHVRGEWSTPLPNYPYRRVPILIETVGMKFIGDDKYIECSDVLDRELHYVQYGLAAGGTGWSAYRTAKGSFFLSRIE